MPHRRPAPHLSLMATGALGVGLAAAGCSGGDLVLPASAEPAAIEVVSRDGPAGRGPAGSLHRDERRPGRRLHPGHRPHQRRGEGDRAVDLRAGVGNPGGPRRGHSGRGGRSDAGRLAPGVGRGGRPRHALAPARSRPAETAGPRSAAPSARPPAPRRPPRPCRAPRATRLAFVVQPRDAEEDKAISPPPRCSTRPGTEGDGYTLVASYPGSRRWRAPPSGSATSRGILRARTPWWWNW